MSHSNQRYWWFVANSTMRSNFVVASASILHLFSRIVKAHKPVSIQAFGSELAVEVLDISSQNAMRSSEAEMALPVGFLGREKSKTAPF